MVAFHLGSPWLCSCPSPHYLHLSQLPVQVDKIHLESRFMCSSLCLQHDQPVWLSYNLKIMEPWALFPALNASSGFVFNPPLPVSCGKFIGFQVFAPMAAHIRSPHANVPSKPPHRLHSHNTWCPSYYVGVGTPPGPFPCITPDLYSSYSIGFLIPSLQPSRLTNAVKSLS